MTKYVVELNEEDYQMIKDCHSKNPSLMKAMDDQRVSGKLAISPDEGDLRLGRRLLALGNSDEARLK